MARIGCSAGVYGEHTLRPGGLGPGRIPRPPFGQSRRRDDVGSEPAPV